MCKVIFQKDIKEAKSGGEIFTLSYTNPCLWLEFLNNFLKLVFRYERGLTLSGNF